MTFTDLASVPSNPPAPFTDRLRLAVAAYLARFKGSSREHTESDLRLHLELYIRWMQEIRRFKPSTVSRRFSVAAGFYRTCVIDGTWSTRPPTTYAVPQPGRTRPGRGRQARAYGRLNTWG
jgi:hypothetical protein